MTRVTFTVPRLFNDGTEVPADKFAQIGRDVVRLAGGFTLTESSGVWLSPIGEIHKDNSLVFTVDTGSDDTVDGLRLLASIIAIELEQEAVYFTTADIAVEFITPGIPA